ncbi:MAG: low molecular weight phosphotyrosine protein phosphatase [Alphaproteobacteria bacterium]|nr:low molecular weight phosphotyrosine protein phosphatase [Alphaproteobacteria bacterium]
MRSNFDYAVLFVCTGNICRSPTADGVFRRLVAEAGLDGRIRIDSAGVSGWHAGEPPDLRTQEAARDRGYDLSGLRARAVEPSDFSKFDLLLAMDSGHEETLKRQAPNGTRERIRLFMSFAPEMGARDVPDPYYGGADGFTHVLDLIEAACRGLLRHVRAELKA